MNKIIDRLADLLGVTQEQEKKNALMLYSTDPRPEDYGAYIANKRTHKQYLRQHRLGKFKKK